MCLAIQSNRQTRRSWRGDPPRIFQTGQRVLTRVLQRIRIDEADIDMKFGPAKPAATNQAITAMDVNGHRDDMDDTGLLCPRAVALVRGLLEKSK